jgi:outer membrane protein
MSVSCDRAVTFAALASLFAAASPGCANVQRARAIQDPSSAVPGERTPTVAELGLEPTGPVELGVLLQHALEVNPTVVQARHAVEITEARVREAEAALYPSASASATTGYRDAKSAGGVSVEHRFNSFGFDVSWLLFDFGRTRAQARSLGELWLASLADLRTAELTVAFEVRSAYIELSRRMALLQVADETVHQFEVHLEQVREFVEVGTRIPYDETKAQVDLGNARLAQVRARDAVLAGQGTLANAIGLAEIVDWLPDFDAPLPDVPEEFEVAWALAREGQPALASAAARESASSLLVDASVAALYPSLDLSFGFTAAGPSFPLSWSWLFGPGLSYLVYDGGGRLAAIDEAAAALRSSRAAHAQLEQQAWLDTRTAWIGIQDARQRVELSTLTAENAAQQLDLAQGLFAVGKNTSVDLADAEQALAFSKADLVQAKADLQAATASLARAIGIVVEKEPGAAP